MGCGSSSAQVGTANEATMDAIKKGGNADHPDSASSPVKGEYPSEAFEIPFDDHADGLIKRHPPKRFQKLEEQAQSSTAPTIEELEEKLANAELRRKRIIDQKVSMAKQMQKQFLDGGDENENSTDEATNDEDKR